MAANLGFALLLLVFSTSIFLPFFIFFSTRATKKNIKNESAFEEIKVAKILITLIFFSAVFSQISLIYSYVTSDYSVLNVYQNSHHLKPLIYKISGSWGNHEGSMLLLITVLCAYSLAFIFLSKITPEKKIIIAATQSIIISAFAAFTAFTSNPFQRIFPIPSEGLGLNPVLQDIGLSMHPPMLYTGYIGFSLIFSFAIAGLITEKIDRDFARYLKGWLFFSWGFLTLGIGLGSWWAYRELGWGGYWFWDPVENISLMPWLAATALIHCLKSLESKEIFKKWTAFLAILTFILCLLGIFLTRSGVLTSVHSFAVDAKRGFFVILLISLIGGLGLLIFGAKSNKLANSKIEFHFSSKIMAILINNYFLILALFIVLLGTLYPLFSQSFFDQFISIGPEYYNKLFTVLLLPFLIFLSLSYSLNYSEKTALQKILNRSNSLVCLLAASITSLTFVYQEKADFSQIIILFLAIFVALLSILFFAKNLFKDKKIKFFSSQIITNAPVSAAHLGFASVVIGIILTSSFGLTKELNIKENESVKISNYDIKLSRVTYEAGANFVARQGEFEVKKNNLFYAILKPQLRFYPVSNQTTNEAATKHSFFGDLYLVLGQKDENNFYALRIYHKPFIYLIWLGCAMIFAGAMIKILQTTLISKKNAQ
ncbi:MAG: heme lyase CcmF/NrfE family subunit [Proteobacteria bacterium]|nr:heme lyase CcmF/NrfE family subunit [Pseudomonadota bacterium]